MPKHKHKHKHKQFKGNDYNKDYIEGWIKRIKLDADRARADMAAAINELKSAEGALVNKREGADGLVRSAIKSVEKARSMVAEIAEDCIYLEKDMWCS